MFYEPDIQKLRNIHALLLDAEDLHFSPPEVDGEFEIPDDIGDWYMSFANDDNYQNEVYKYLSNKNLVDVSLFDWRKRLIGRSTTGELEQIKIQKINAEMDRSMSSQGEDATLRPLVPIKWVTLENDESTVLLKLTGYGDSKIDLRELGFKVYEDPDSYEDRVYITAADGTEFYSYNYHGEYTRGLYTDPNFDSKSKKNVKLLNTFLNEHAVRDKYFFDNNGRFDPEGNAQLHEHNKYTSVHMEGDKVTYGTGLYSVFGTTPLIGGTPMTVDVDENIWKWRGMMWHYTEIARIAVSTYGVPEGDVKEYFDIVASGQGNPMSANNKFTEFIENYGVEPGQIRKWNREAFEYLRDNDETSVKGFLSTSDLGFVDYYEASAGSDVVEGYTVGYGFVKFDMEGAFHDWNSESSDIRQKIREQTTQLRSWKATLDYDDLERITGVNGILKAMDKEDMHWADGSLSYQIQNADYSDDALTLIKKTNKNLEGTGWEIKTNTGDKALDLYYNGEKVFTAYGDHDKNIDPINRNFTDLQPGFHPVLAIREYLFANMTSNESKLLGQNFLKEGESTNWITEHTKHQQDIQADVSNYSKVERIWIDSPSNGFLDHYLKDLKDSGVKDENIQIVKNWILGEFAGSSASDHKQKAIGTRFKEMMNIRLSDPQSIIKATTKLAGFMDIDGGAGLTIRNSGVPTDMENGGINSHDLQKILYVNEKYTNADTYLKNDDLRLMFDQGEADVYSDKMVDFYSKKYRDGTMDADDHTAANIWKFKMEKKDYPAMMTEIKRLQDVVMEDYEDIGRTIIARVVKLNDKNGKLVWNQYDDDGNPVVKSGIDWEASEQGDFTDIEWNKYKKNFYRDIVETAIFMDEETVKVTEQIESLFDFYQNQYGISLNVERAAVKNRGYWDITGNVLMDSIRGITNSIPALFGDDAATFNLHQMKRKWEYFDRAKFNDIDGVGSFVSWGFTAFLEQVPNIALVVGTMGAGNALRFSMMANRILVGSTFGLISAGQKRADLEMRVQMADAAKIQLDNLEEAWNGGKGSISESFYLTQKRQLNRVIELNDLTAGEKWGSIAMTGLVEGGITMLGMGTFQIGKNVLGMFKPQNVGLTNLYNYSTGQAVKTAMGQIGLATAGEVLEETSIYAFTEIGDWMILDEDPDFSHMLEVGVTSIIAGGGVNSTSISYSAVMNHSLKKDARAELEALDENIAEVQKELDNMNPLSGKWKNDKRGYKDRRNELISTIQELQRQKSGEFFGLEIDVLALSKEDHQQLTILSRSLAAMYRQAGIKPGDSRKLRDQKLSSYIKSQRGKGRDFANRISEIEAKMEKIRDGKNYNNVRGKIFGDNKDRQKQVQKILEEKNPNYKGASLREKLVMEVEYVRSLVESDRIKILMNDSRYRESVEKEVYSEFNEKEKKVDVMTWAQYKEKYGVEEKTDLQKKMEAEAFKKYATILMVSTVEGVINYGKDSDSASKVLEEINNKYDDGLKVVEASNENNVQEMIDSIWDENHKNYDSDLSLSQRLQLTEQLKQGITDIKTGKRNGLIIGNKYIVSDKVAAENAIRNGDILAGTVISHEFGHWVTDMAFTKSEVKTQALLLDKFFGKSKKYKYLHDVVVLNVLSNIKTSEVDSDGNYKMLYNKDLKFEEQSDMFFDEYLRELETQLRKWEFRMHYNQLVKQMEKQGDKYFKGDFKIKKGEDALFYMVSHIKSWKEGKLSDVVKAKIESRQTQKQALLDRAGVKKGDSRKVIEAKIEETIESLEKEKKGEGEKFRKQVEDARVFEDQETKSSRKLIKEREKLQNQNRELSGKLADPKVKQRVLDNTARIKEINKNPGVQIDDLYEKNKNSWWYDKEAKKKLDKEFPKDLRNKDIEASKEYNKRLKEIEGEFNGLEDILELYKPLVREQAKKYRNVPNFNEELFIDMLLASERGVMGMAKYSFDGTKNNSLNGYLNKFLPQRAKDILKTGLVSDAVYLTPEGEAKDITTKKTKYVETSKNIDTKILDNFDLLKVVTIDGKSIVVGDYITQKLKSIMGSKLKEVNKEISPNKQISDLIREIKPLIGTMLQDVVLLSMRGDTKGQMGNNLETWLKNPKNKSMILDGLTTTWLSRNFPQAVEKSVGGRVVKNDKGKTIDFIPKFVKYKDWKGKKIDKEIAAVHGRTAQHQIKQRNKSAVKEISNAEIINKYTKRTDTGRISPRQEPTNALAYQIGSELGLEIIDNEFNLYLETGKKGTLISLLSQRQLDILGKEVAVNDLRRQMDRGNIKYSSIADITSADKMWLFENLENIGNGYFKNGKSINGAINELDPNKNRFGKTRKKLIDELQMHFDVHEPIKKNWEAAKKLKIAKNLVEYITEETMKKDFDENLRNVLGLTKKSIDFNNIQQLESVADAAKQLAKIVGKEKAIRFFSFMYPSGRIGGTKTKRVDGKLVDDPGYWDNLITKKRKEIKNAVANKKPTKKLRNTLKKLIQKKKADAKPDIRYGIFKNKADFESFVLNSLEDGKPINVAPDVSQSVGKDLSTPEAIKKDENAAKTNKDFLMEMTEACTKLMNTKKENGEPFMSKNDFGMIITSLLNSGMNSALARAAHVQYTTKGKKSSKTHIYEHIIPRKIVAMYMVNHAVENTNASKGDLKQLLDDFSVAIIPIKADNIIGDYYKSSMPNSWTLGQDILNRYFNAKTFGKIKLELIDVKTGKLNKKSVAWSKVTDNIIDSKYEHEIAIGKSIRQARLIQKSSKGMSIWDFDDTLAKSKSNVLFTAPDGTKGKLNAEEFAKNGADLLEQGYKFDFSEFSKVVKGEKGPFFQKFVDRIKKFGVKDNFILTARPVDSNVAIKEFLEGVGLKIPLKNITGLANSTSEAKALWIADKIGNEGYNNIYFADDALQNVQAVKNMLDQFDVKGKVQQAKVKHSSVLNITMNEILENASGIEAVKTFSDVQAKLKGAKRRWSFGVPHSAQDFKGLLYNFLGKGPLGDAQMEFFQTTLIDPFARGVEEMNTHKQQNMLSYKKLLKEFKSVRKRLRKKIKGTDFRTDHAIRVYLWAKHGYEIPGLSKRDQKMLIDLVESDVDLTAFAEGLDIILGDGRGYSTPGENWIVENINYDLSVDGSLGESRMRFFEEWKQNKDIIFSKENLNKIEVIYGSKFREALEDTLYAMEKGTNRPSGSNRFLNTYMNWMNGATGTVMFFNMRSAVLQTISAANYLNWTDNNPAKAAAAFANFPQFIKDFVYIFNSDMLKQRRGGGKMGVNEAELFEATKGSRNPATIVRWLLAKGFKPTQIADSFAIASGGATFYRNRINTYLKQGMTEEQAQKQAWLDFQEATEVSQQSSRPDMVSQQQRNPIGRMVLAFANTPMQYGRIMNKAARDLYNGRGDAKTNVSKIVYYGFIQSLIFNTLQQALSAILGDDDEEEVTEATERVLNGMVDGWLKTWGYQGQAVISLKNTIFEYLEQDAKETDEEFFTRADHTYTLIEALNFSPPIGIKARKVYSGIQTLRYNRDVIKEMGFSIDNPAANAYGNFIEAAFNIPLGRVTRKIDNLQQAANDNNAAWQRVALGLGWNMWDVGIKDEKIEQIKLEIKKRDKDQKELQKKLNKENKEILKKQEKEEEYKGLLEKFEKEQRTERHFEEKDIKCSGVTNQGTRCTNIVDEGVNKCYVHDSEEKLESMSEEEKKNLPNPNGDKVNCSAQTKSKKNCKNKTNNKTGLCWAHD